MEHKLDQNSYFCIKENEEIWNFAITNVCLNPVLNVLLSRYLFATENYWKIVARDCFLPRFAMIISY